MTNEEKAQEIKANDVCCVWNGGCPNVYNAAMQMAEWKEKQMIEKACEWLGPVFKDLAGYNCGSDLIKDFKRAMEE